MSRTRVVVTGLGATTPLGGDVSSTWEGLLAGRTGVTRLTWDCVEDLPVRFAAQAAVEPSDSGVLSAERRERLDRGQQFALIAATEAMRDAGYDYSSEDGLRVDPDRLGVVLSTGIGGLQTAIKNYDGYLESGWEVVSPGTYPMMRLDGGSTEVCREFKAYAGSHGLSSACASSAEAVAYGMDMIRNDRADVVIVGGTEACVHPLQIAAFGAMRAMSTHNEEPEIASRPFDKARDGFVLGEGSAILILESEEFAAARGARVHAIAAGVGYSSDGHDMVQPPEDGRGAAKAMSRCLANAELDPEQIVHIHPHATATPQGDVAEINAIKTAFGAHAYNLPLTGTKSMTGHLLGGAGALGALITILTLREGLIPPVRNLVDLDDAVDLDIVTDEPRKLLPGPASALANSFGFGGHNVTLAFTRV
ncbi:beta-ketoacyl-[acyl-carrier-protein] synthase family protein [Actinocorallia longicatena]|uniref:Beta-ketoacyl-[acyl-carrier-protein] synthase family protein n=1 Tax=Actinocorallia longicatena TaxID=111803 RepID=A0ABP6QEZ2_9ACTN